MSWGTFLDVLRIASFPQGRARSSRTTTSLAWGVYGEHRRVRVLLSLRAKKRFVNSTKGSGRAQHRTGHENLHSIPVRGPARPGPFCTTGRRIFAARSQRRQCCPSQECSQGRRGQPSQPAPPARYVMTSGPLKNASHKIWVFRFFGPGPGSGGPREAPQGHPSGFWDFHEAPGTPPGPTTNQTNNL